MCKLHICVYAIYVCIYAFVISTRVSVDAAHIHICRFLPHICVFIAGLKATFADLWRAARMSLRSRQSWRMLNSRKDP